MNVNCMLMNGNILLNLLVLFNLLVVNISPFCFLLFYRYSALKIFNNFLTSFSNCNFLRTASCIKYRDTEI